MAITKYNVFDAKTQELLGVVEPYRIDISPPNWNRTRLTRRWWRVVGRAAWNADTRSCLAAALGNGRRTRMEPA